MAWYEEKFEFKGSRNVEQNSLACLSSDEEQINQTDCEAGTTVKGTTSLAYILNSIMS